MRPRLALPALPLLALALPTCGSTTSEVVLRLSTNTDPTNPVNVDLRLTSQADTASACDPNAPRPTFSNTPYVLRGGAAAIEVRVPTTDPTVRVRVAVCVRHGTQSPWERVATFGFTEGRTLTFPLVIHRACLVEVLTCVNPAPCPQGQLCTERSQTCRNDGTCGDPAVTTLTPYGN